MESQTQSEWKVGVFVTIGLISLAFTILALGGDQMFLVSKMQLKVKFPQVQGLAKGSVVSLSGVIIGNVRHIEFVENDGQLEVTMDIDRSYHSRIPQGSTASVKTQGALGDKYIYIEPGSLTSPPIQEGGYLTAHTGGDLFDVISKRGAELAGVLEVIKEVQTLFQNINRNGRSAQLVDNLLQSSHNLNLFLVEARGALKETRGGTLRRLESVLTKMDEGQGTLGALLNDPHLHNRLSTLLGEQPRHQFLTPLIRDTIRTHEASSGRQ